MGDSLPHTSGPIVCIDFSESREDSLEPLKQAIEQLIDAIQPHEPQLVTYGFHSMNRPARWR